MKVKVLRTDKEHPVPTFIKKGDWIDLYISGNYTFSAPTMENKIKKKGNKAVSNKSNPKDKTLVLEDIPSFTIDEQMLSFGVAMQLPKGFEAHIAPRSSTFKRTGLLLTNSMGIIDNTYCGNNDIWRAMVIAMKDCRVNDGDRLFQFRLELSQKATVWQKIKWLFTRKIKFIDVDVLTGKNRRGYGSTGN